MTTSSETVDDCENSWSKLLCDQSRIIEVIACSGFAISVDYDIYTETYRWTIPTLRSGCRIEDAAPKPPNSPTGVAASPEIALAVRLQVRGTIAHLHDASVSTLAQRLHSPAVRMAPRSP